MAGPSSSLSWPWSGEAATLDWAATYPLHAAAEAGDAIVLQQLLTAGCNSAEAEPARGWTPLQYAAALGHGDCCEMLLEAGASALNYGYLVEEDDTPCPPLLLAFNAGSFRCVAALLRALRRHGALGEHSMGWARYHILTCRWTCPRLF